MVVEYPTGLLVWEITSTRVLMGGLGISYRTHAKRSHHRDPLMFLQNLVWGFLLEDLIVTLLRVS